MEKNDDDISEISEFDENDIKNFFVESCVQELGIDFTEIDSDSDSVKSIESYDTFNTSDSEILKKEEMKITLLNKYSIYDNPSQSKDEFNILFSHILHELKKEANANDKIKIFKPFKPDESDDSDDSEDNYLHGYKFF